jgi:hypothetical protein
MSGSALPLRTTPSVAEQEGQLIETEATEHLKNTIAVVEIQYRCARLRR